ncbi:MAG TPA: cytochrome c oxidase subunit II transmembrane domain-containing protein [Steroidobacteraceae bacterium]|nr:cytochrome c oxidase subunit II transmembrane domain-containing protein [Steroidobacteraceae bacterium]
MNTLMWICAALAVPIFGAILHSVATFRADNSRSTRYRRATVIEVVWALVPILIVIAAAAPSFQQAKGTAVAVAASE